MKKWALVIGGAVLFSTLAFWAVCRKDSQTVRQTTNSLTFASYVPYNEGHDWQGGGGGEELIVVVNGLPILFSWDSSVDIPPIAQYMNNGVNVVELRGRLTRPARLAIDGQVLQRPDASAWRAIASVIIQPEETGGDKTVTLTFTEKLPFDLLGPLEDLRRLDRRQAQEEITGRLKELYAALAGHDGKKAASLMLEGYKVWSRAAYGRPPTHVEDISRALAAGYSRSDVRLEPFDWNSLKFVFGDRGVLVYSRMWKEQGRPLLFELGPGVPWVRGIVFVRIAGRWVYWSDK